MQCPRKTKTILAVYYTFADIVLLGQCFYYRGFTLSDVPSKPAQKGKPDRVTESSPLLDGDVPQQRRPSSSSWRSTAAVNPTHLSIVTPLVDPGRSTEPPAISNLRPTSAVQTTMLNVPAVLLVCAAGVFGWWTSMLSGSHSYGVNGPGERGRAREDMLEFNALGQVFGYLCALLYLGSRFPQIMSNIRRKSTEGVSMLFFVFACLGNFTYVLSIFAFSPVCSAPARCRPGEVKDVYLRYILVNLSWLLGSFGTLLLDLLIFAQFFLYRRDVGQEEGNGEAVEDSAIGSG